MCALKYIKYPNTTGKINKNKYSFNTRMDKT